MKILNKNLEVIVLYKTFYAFLYTFVFITTSEAQISHGINLSKQNAEKVISIVRGENYKASNDKMVFGYRDRVLMSTSIYYEVFELPINATLSSTDRYVIKGFRYYLTENNYNSSTCSDSYGYSCQSSDIKYVKLEKGGGLKYTIEDLSNNYVGIMIGIDDEITEELMNIASMPFLDILKEAKINSSNRKEKTDNDKFVLYLPDDDEKEVNYIPRYIYQSNVHNEESTIRSKYQISYCGWVNNICAYTLQLEVNNLVSKSSSYKLKIIRGPVA